MSHHLLPIASARETARLAGRLLARRRLLVAATLAAFALAGVSAMVAPWVLGRVVDDVRAGAGADAITVSALLIGAAAVAGGLFTALSVSLLARAGEPALAELREEVLDTALHLDAARVEEAGTGDLMSRVGDDVRTVTGALNEAVPLLVTSGIAVVLTGAGLFALDWRLGLAGLGSAPLYVLGLRWYLPRSGPYYRRERVAQGERAQAVVSGLQGAATLRAYGREQAQLDRIEHSSRHALTIAVDVFVLLTRFFARNNRAELVGLALVLGTGFLLVRSDETTVGAVTAAALYFHRLFNPIGALLFLFDELQSSGASLARLAGVSAMARAAEPAAPVPATPGELVLSGIAHSYVSGTPALAPTDLSIAPGERVALVGATGAGKTTLGAIAAGVLRPTCGTVSLGGVRFEDLGPRALRRHVSLVSQEVHVFSGTVRESLTLARPGASDDEVWAALDTVLAAAWARALPEGLDTVVGDHGHPLTPAQAQQLALARIALRDPWVVVLDEATAEAGSAGARELEQAALAVTTGRSALVVAHRLTQSEAADRVVVLHDGVVVEQGTHDELLARGGRYAALWEAWTTG
jgi:ABC-type multidrug transport system fused ATPase/permease subunit